MNNTFRDFNSTIMNNTNDDFGQILTIRGVAYTTITTKTDYHNEGLQYGITIVISILFFMFICVGCCVFCCTSEKQVYIDPRDYDVDSVSSYD